VLEGVFLSSGVEPQPNDLVIEVEKFDFILGPVGSFAESLLVSQLPYHVKPTTGAIGYLTGTGTEVNRFPVPTHHPDSHRTYQWG
jgi:hypothetical protein